MNSKEVSTILAEGSGNIDGESIRKKLIELFKGSEEIGFHKKLVRSCGSLKEWLMSVDPENKSTVDEFWLEIASLATTNALEDDRVPEGYSPNVIELKNFR
ncbi:MAG: hypothetical protein KBC50_03200 [Candidatus Pacebacteria bacterium]|nr:hypothetical protein [Candidatus Paceibacterota bacterium]